MLETRLALRDDAVAEEADLTLQKHHALELCRGHRVELVAFLAVVHRESRYYPAPRRDKPIGSEQQSQRGSNAKRVLGIL